MRLLASAAVLLLACLLAPACSKTGGPVPGAPQSREIRKEYREGPVRLTVILDKDTLTIAQDLTLTLQADADQDYDVELPAFGDKLGEFGIVDYRQEPPQLAGEGRVVTRKIYRLEPFLSGDYTIAPLTVTFRKKPEPSAQDSGDHSPVHSLITDELHIKVQSLLGHDRKALRLHPIFGPVSLPAKPVSLIYAGLGLALVLLGGAGLFYWSKRRKERSEAAAPAVPAHELAYGQLEELLEERLPERGEYKLFFARISDVVRSYIENRFGLHAPKLTSEEFLASMSRNPPFGPELCALLDEFLRRCDLVKFAEERPESEDMRQAAHACRAFIDATKEEAPTGG